MMSAATPVLTENNTSRYDALVRISETLCACCDCEKLAQTLAAVLEAFLPFDRLFLVFPKENSKQIGSFVWGKGKFPLPDLPLNELPISEVFKSPEPVHIPDWSVDERFPRFKDWAKSAGLRLGSSIVVPLTTPHRRLGAFGIGSDLVVNYSAEDIDFLRLIARVVAFAIDDGLNLKRAQAAHASLQHQNERLQLLLNMTTGITSNLDFRELLRAIAANVREVMHCDAVAICLADSTAETFRIFALDFPEGKGFVKEDLVFSPGKDDPGRQALETLRPVVVPMTAEAQGATPEIHTLVIAEGIKLSCVIPLVNRGRALGTLAVARRTDASFTAEDIEFLSQASGQIAIALENSLAYQEITELKDKLAQEKLYLEEEIRSELNFEQIIGNSTALRRVLELVETVAPSDSTALLLGETGTGKELIARAIHDHSKRKDRTFVKVNCAAIPTGLLESELFGHEKGAFTGAISQKVGRLELADQGTLFLDEVGDIPIEIQPKLLRALQEREFERLGSTHTRKVNVRLIAATNRDLEKMVANKEFRSDLYYRLNVFPIQIPPLRERKEDIPLLATYFVQKFAKQMQKHIEAIPVAAMKGLTTWEWPGNIRELENFVERAVILTRGKSLEAPLGELYKLTNSKPMAAAAQAQQPDIARIVKETITALGGGKDFADERTKKQREDIVRALSESKGRVGGADGAAARMGINRTTLLSRIKKLGIDPRQYA
jgi:formate hydrogenlyase transcriptional activator